MELAPVFPPDLSPANLLSCFILVLSSRFALTTVYSRNCIFVIVATVIVYVSLLQLEPLARPLQGRRLCTEERGNRGPIPESASENDKSTGLYNRINSSTFHLRFFFTPPSTLYYSMDIGFA